MAQALDRAQRCCHRALADSYAIAPGQRIPRRIEHRGDEP
jgi:hydroxymethylpyrimidine/phosphomethylpyrimidine kinase